MKFNAKVLAVAALIASSASVAHADDTTYLSCASGAGASMKCKGVSLDDIMSTEATASLTGKKQTSVLFQCDRSNGTVQCHRMSVDLSINATPSAETPAPENSGIMAVPPAQDSGQIPPGRMKPTGQSGAASENKQPPVYIQVTKAPNDGSDASKKAEPAKASTKAGDPAQKEKTVRFGPVKPGDTLNSIVGNYYGEKGNHRDLMAAVFLANKGSFVSQNPSLLKAGAYLNMPPVSSVQPGLWSETKSSFDEPSGTSTMDQPDLPSKASVPHSDGIEPGDVVQKANAVKSNHSGLIVGGSDSSGSVSTQGGTDADRQKLIDQVLQIQSQINSLQKALPNK